MPVYKEHHAQYSYGWAKDKGTPLEVARNLVTQWNANLDPGEPKYPTNGRFLFALGVLIHFRRNNIEFDTISDSFDSCFIDPICLACNSCMG